MSLVYRFSLLKRKCCFLYLHYYLSCENDYLKGKLTNLESKLDVLQKHKGANFKTGLQPVTNRPRYKHNRAKMFNDGKLKFALQNH